MSRLMPNHVLPTGKDGLARRAIRAASAWAGYLWQGRFVDYPMAPAHLLIAIRYVERNPVEAGLVVQHGLEASDASSGGGRTDRSMPAHG